MRDPCEHVEALGRFGEQNLTSAFYWAYPPNQSPEFYAFHAFRNYDGKGGRFQDELVYSEAPPQSSLWVSRDPSGTKIDRNFYLDEAMAITVDFLRLLQVAQNN